MNGVFWGQLLFSSMSHRLYDLGLYRLVTGFFWRCPTARLLDNYADHVSNSHLEIGVGSGYFLHHTLCPDIQQRLSLLDLNRRCLKKSANRLSIYAPNALHQSILQPVRDGAGSFASAGMNYVLHCIPGSFCENRVMFENIHATLQDGGVFFGATLLPGRSNGRVASRAFMALLNWLGVFHNARHTEADLRRMLAAVFRSSKIEMIGDAAIFVAVK